ncbi:MAG: methylglyoxal synthase [Firmicutes bacterium]|nr:methylglyoxal synthase [Bacillota bacterium]
MNIALAAHNNKKSLMQNLCIAYRPILKEHVLHGTATTARAIEEVTDLTINRYLPGPLGGLRQIASQIISNELDMVILFHEPGDFAFNAEFLNIMNLCDRQNIPIATNLASAEILLLGLSSGLLDWRDVHKKTQGDTV